MIKILSCAFLLVAPAALAVKIRNQLPLPLLQNVRIIESNRQHSHIRSLQAECNLDQDRQLDASVLLDFYGEPHLLTPGETDDIGKAMMQTYNEIARCEQSQFRKVTDVTLVPVSFEDLGERLFSLEFTVTAECQGCSSTTTLLDYGDLNGRELDSCPCRGPTVFSFQVVFEQRLEKLIQDQKITNIDELDMLAELEEAPSCPAFSTFTMSDVVVAFFGCPLTLQQADLEILAKRFVETYNRINGLNSRLCDRFFREIMAATAVLPDDYTVDNFGRRGASGRQLEDDEFPIGGRSLQEDDSFVCPDYFEIRFDITARCRGCDVDTITLFDEEEDVNFFESFDDIVLAPSDALNGVVGDDDDDRDDDGGDEVEDDGGGDEAGDDGGGDEVGAGDGGEVQGDDEVGDDDDDGDTAIPVQGDADVGADDGGNDEVGDDDDDGDVTTPTQIPPSPPPETEEVGGGEVGDDDDDADAATPMPIPPSPPLEAEEVGGSEVGDDDDDADAAVTTPIPTPPSPPPSPSPKTEEVGGGEVGDDDDDGDTAATTPIPTPPSPPPSPSPKTEEVGGGEVGDDDDDGDAAATTPIPTPPSPKTEEVGGGEVGDDDDDGGVATPMPIPPSPQNPEEVGGGEVGDDDDDGQRALRGGHDSHGRQRFALPHRRRLQKSDCRCPIDPKYRAVTEKEMIDALDITLDFSTDTLPPLTVKDVIEIEDVDCDPNVDNFQTNVGVDFYSDSLDGVITNIIANTLAASFVRSYNSLAERFCDPLFRHVETAEVVSNAATPAQGDRTLQGQRIPIFNFNFNSNPIVTPNSTSSPPPLLSNFTFKFDFRFFFLGSCRGCPKGANLFVSIQG